MFTPLNFPKASLQLTQSEGKVFVWDIFRKKKLQLTPEEWVRQHVLHYLVNEKQVPVGLIASEFNIEVNKLKRRCDGVIFGRNSKPIAIIECKAPEIKLSENTFYQIAQYNYKLRVDWLILTNGLETIVAWVNHKQQTIDYIKDIPSFDEMI
ncbi:MAG: type I restriction enzyme HsdR N-terminal domain-containing protein [Brumimicrobium sp.]